MKKTIALFVLISIAFTTPLLAEATGRLNVYTDLKEAEIYVDGEKVGQENLVRYVLPVGDHYVKVMYQGKKAYAEVVQIYENQDKTIVSDNFVDFKTDAPSRGAIDKEAARLRETRGNMAFGAYGGSPASGLSFKWWIFEKLGVQVSGFTKQLTPEEIDDNIGYRILINFADKVYAEDTISAYGALGYGKASYTNKNNAEDSVFTDMVEAALGLELRLGREGSQVLYSSGDPSDILSYFLQLLTLGVLNTCYLSLEFGVESKYRDWREPDRGNERYTNMKMSGGLHYYF
ncbi:MAG: PEGA domain-containing protein [Candidatus Margulisbacteria bacterium]|nr:PEGA domain-containing protein [Candidatus Margulisiibacteriota bacterium]